MRTYAHRATHIETHTEPHIERERKRKRERAHAREREKETHTHVDYIDEFENELEGSLLKHHVYM